MTPAVQARQAHLAECAILRDFNPTPPGVDSQLHSLALHLKADLVELYSIDLDPHTMTRWFLWLLEVELGKYATSGLVAKLYRRRLVGDEPTKEEWAAAATAEAVAEAAAEAAAAAWAAEAAWAAAEATARWAAEATARWAAATAETKVIAIDRMCTALFTCARGGYH